MVEMRSALSNIFAMKLRSFLAILGVLVGTASVVAMVSGGQLATRQALMQLNALGPNLFAITFNSYAQTSSSIKNEPDLNDILNLKKNIPAILNMSVYANLFSMTQFEGYKLSTEVVAATASLQNLAKLSLKKGRFLTAEEGRNAYCIIGNKIYNQLLPYTNNPIGKQILISSHYFTIVGILNHWTENSFVMADLNNSIIVPIETAQFLSAYATPNNILLLLKPATDIDTITAQIKAHFAASFPKLDFYFHSAKQILQSIKKEQDILTVLLGFIGSISLLVGGIGIMNIMLVSVVERRREIGIRLAIGAQPKNIILLFLIESVILTLLGGILGVLLGILISFLIAFIKHWDFSLFLLPPLIGFVVSVFIGIFFGFYPAVKASQIDPIKSLHAE